MEFTIGRKNEPHLCRKCEHSLNFRDGAGEKAICYWAGQALPISGPVSECDRFSPRGQLTQYEFERTAWILETKAGRVVGFKPPKEPR